MDFLGKTPQRWQCEEEVLNERSGYHRRRHRGADRTDRLLFVELCRGSRSGIDSSGIKGELKQVQDLLDKGADVDAKDETGITALIGASHEGHIDIVKLLLEWEAGIDAGFRCRSY
jgi:ankyrin repeat protein